MAEPEPSVGRDGPELSPVPTFDALFHTEYPKMVALAAAVSGNRQHAEDIAQEAMARLGKNWSKVQGFQKPGAWVRRVTINLALSHRRRLLNEARAMMRLRALAPDLPAEPPPVHGPVWAAVAELPPKQRAAIALRHLEGLDIDEIADILDISPSTARVHLHRARQTLRDRLEEVQR